MEFDEVYHDDNRTISSSTRVAHTTEITISQDTFDPLKNLGIGLHAYFMSQSWLMTLSGILLMIGLVMMVGYKIGANSTPDQWARSL
jgi:hypothetical protein